MSDLVGRLARALVDVPPAEQELDRIDAKAEIERLRAALRKIADEPKPRTPDDLRAMAKEALGE